MKAAIFANGKVYGDPKQGRLEPGQVNPVVRIRGGEAALNEFLKLNSGDRGRVIEAWYAGLARVEQPGLF
jgi:hypothetical protein